MKHIITTILLAILTTSSLWAEEFVIEDVEINPGGTGTASICLNNDGEDYVSFQFLLCLPKGITLNEEGCSLSERFADQDAELAVGMVDKGGEYRLAAVSLNLKPISGHSGEVMKLSLSVSPDFDYSRNNVSLLDNTLATKDAQKIRMEDAEFHVNPVKTEQTIPDFELPNLTCASEGTKYTFPATTVEGLALEWEFNDADKGCFENNILYVYHAGEFEITATQAGDYYHLPLSKSFRLIVNKAILRITAEDKTKNVYEENPELTFTYSESSDGGATFKNYELVELDVFPTISTSAQKDSPSGEYPIKAYGAVSDDYDFIYIDGTLTINKISQSIEMTEISPLTYGDDKLILPYSTAEGLSLDWMSDNPDIADINGNNLSINNAGTTTITAYQKGNEYYEEFSTSYELVVNKAELTIIADNKSKAAFEENPELTVSYEGFVYGDNESVLIKKPTITTTASSVSPAGDYAITASGAEAANYVMQYVDGVLTINKASQNIDFMEFPTMTYGDDTYTLVTRTKEGQELVWTSEDEQIAVVEDNNLIIKGAGEVVISAFQNGNDYYAELEKKFKLVVNKAPLTISVNDTIKQYGDDIPEFTVEYEGFQYEDNEDSLRKKPTATTSATKDSPVGLYPIVVEDAASSNYDITYKNGYLSIIKKNQSVEIADTLKLVYGANGYLLPETTNEKLPIMWFSGNTDIVSVNGNRLTIKGTGTTNINGMQVGNDILNAISISAILEVSKAPLIISANDTTKFVGEDNPEFILTYDGFVYGEDESVLNSLPVVVCEADRTSPAGEYTIELSEGTADNYEITLVNGTLTIKEQPHEKGDVNEDGNVDISDIVAVINQIAGTASYKYADVNEDKNVDISDIVAIINTIAGS